MLRAKDGYAFCHEENIIGDELETDLHHRICLDWLGNSLSSIGWEKQNSRQDSKVDHHKHFRNSEIRWRTH